MKEEEIMIKFKEEEVVKLDKKVITKKANVTMTIGFTLTGIALIIILSLLVVSYLNPIQDISSSWYLFVLIGVAIILLVFGVIFLKRSNKYKNILVSKQNQEFVEKLNEKLNKK